MRINLRKFLFFTLTLALFLIAISALDSARADPEYHPYHEVVQDMESVAENHPDIVRLYNLTEEYGVPLTHQNRSVLALRITDPDGDSSEPEVLITGCHHAREWISVEVPLYFIHYLVDNYGTDPYVTYLVDNRDIWIIPMVNPDGYIKSWAQNDRANNGSGWRKNCRDNNGDGKIDGNDGVDPNRNYGYKWGYDDSGSSPNPTRLTYRGPSPFSEPETQAIRALSLDKDFDVVIHYHSYMNAILYPWAYADLDTPDHETFVRLAKQMALYNGYVYGNSKSGTVYNCNGEATDWHYANRSSFAFTIELGSNKDKFIPDESRIIPICEENLQVNLFACLAADDPRSLEEFADPEANADSSGLWNHSGLGDHWMTASEAAVGEHSWYCQVHTEPETLAELKLNLTLIREEHMFLSLWEKYDLSWGSDTGVFLKDEGGEYTQLEEYIPEQGTRSPVSDWRPVYYNLTPYLDSSPRTLSFILDSDNGGAGDYWYIDGLRIASAPPFELRGDGNEDNEEYNFTIDPEHYELKLLPGEGHTIPVNITNEAKENNTIDLSSRTDQSDWLINLTVGGEEVDNVSLTPDETRMVNITLTLPEGLLAGELGNFTVSFQSRENTSQNRSLSINASVGVFYNISLHDPGEVSIRPKEEKVIELTVHNHGNSRVKISPDLTVLSGNDEEWSFSFPDDPTAEPYSHEYLYLNVTAPAKIDPGTRLKLEIGVEVEGHPGGSGRDAREMDLIIEEYVEAGFVLLSSPEAVPGEESEFRLKLMNHGNVMKTFDLAITSDWEAYLSEPSKQLDAYSNAILTLTLIPPEGIYPDEQASVRLNIRVEGSLLNSTELTFTSTASYRVEIDAEDTNLTIPAGRYKTVSLTVYNRGNTANNITMSVGNPGGFELEFSKEELLIQAFGSRTIDLNITTPPSLNYGDLLCLTPTAASDDEPEQSDSVSLDLTIGKSYGVKLSIDSEDRKQEASPKEQAEFLVTLENTGNARTIINLTLSGVPEGWTARLDDYNISVDSGKSRKFHLYVLPSSGAKNKDEARITVTAQCGDDDFGYETYDISVTTIVRNGKSEDGISVLHIVAGVLALVFIGIVGFIFLQQRKEVLPSLLARIDRMLGQGPSAVRTKEEAVEERPAPVIQNVSCPSCEVRFDVELPKTGKKTSKTICPECGTIFSFEREEPKEEETRPKEGAGVLAAGVQNVACPFCNARFDVELPKGEKKTVRTMCLECGAIFSFERGKPEAEKREEEIEGVPGEKEEEKREEEIEGVPGGKEEEKEMQRKEEVPGGKEEEKEMVKEEGEPKRKEEEKEMVREEGEMPEETKGEEAEEPSRTPTSEPIKTKVKVVTKEAAKPLSLKLEPPSSGIVVPKTMRCPKCGHKVFLKGKEERVKCIFCGTVIIIEREKKGE